ncbi:related to transaldolase [Ustilago trichophora]|uniref:Transaldolase n=1 Tax=Ustilago trichophora TaxID=86804 RepID=A0A5C3DQ96_9BASI|nr:related to transaldolase [Ustilago trichophora]
MTLDQPSSGPVHISNSLLAELGSFSIIDFDNNVASIAVQHNIAHRRLLELSSTNKTASSAAQQQVLSEFSSLFRDMTSNQIIVLFTYTGLLDAEPAKAHKLLQNCMAAAKQLEAGTWNGEQLSTDMLERLSVASGLTGTETSEERFQHFASDILTVHFGLEMLPNLLSNGNLHAQTATSQSYNLKATVKHARRFVALYELISGGSVDSQRVCIKIPSTIPGLQAMRYLSSGGQLDESHLGGPLPEGNIQVLATTIFAVEQGLAAAQAAGAIYTAPYINALAAHFFGAENPSQADKQIALSAGGRSMEETIYPLQRCLLRLRKDDPTIKTQVMAASFLRIQEAVELCGLDHVTLGAPIVERLANTELTAEYEQALKEARAKFSVADDAELERYGAVSAAQEAQEVGYGAWLKESAQSYTRLQTVLEQDERCRYMLADALARFTSAEEKLRDLFSA